MPFFARSFLPCATALLALAGCGEAPKQGGAPPPPTVTVATPAQRTIVDHDEYVGRFVAVEHASRCAPACRAISRACISTTARWSSRAISCSRSTSGRSRTRSTRRAPISTLARSNLTYHRGRSRSRQAARARQDHHRAGLRAARAGPGATPKASVVANEAAVRQAELDLEFTELARAGRGPHRRPARDAGQSRHRRHRRQHHAARDHRVARSDPARVHLRRGLLPALRAALARRPRGDQP